MAAVFIPFENWPFTPAPMFAHYVGPETPRYRFIFKADLDDGTSKEVGYPSVGANWSLMRFFFKYIYGSAEPGSVFNVFPNDSKSDFEQRLTIFFKAFSKLYGLKHPQNSIRSIKLLVGKLAPSSKKIIETHEVGIFEQEGFSMTWSGKDQR